MYQTVLKRYELISPYPFFVAVKVFLITCLVLLVLVFSVLSPIQSQGFLVLHMCEWACSHRSSSPGFPPSAHGTSQINHHPLSAAGPGLIHVCGSSSELREATLASLLPPLLLSCLPWALPFSPPFLSGRTCKVPLRRVPNVLCSSMSNWSPQHCLREGEISTPVQQVRN